jgi:hypothetical protein
MNIEIFRMVVWAILCRVKRLQDMFLGWQKQIPPLNKGSRTEFSHAADRLKLVFLIQLGRENCFCPTKDLWQI